MERHLRKDSPAEKLEQYVTGMGDGVLPMLQALIRDTLDDIKAQDPGIQRGDTVWYLDFGGFADAEPRLVQCRVIEACLHGMCGTDGFGDPEIYHYRMYDSVHDEYFQASVDEFGSTLFTDRDEAEALRALSEVQKETTEEEQDL
jgi:hypothetical protein